MFYYLTVSIPLEQGRVFRRETNKEIQSCLLGLNPFGTGQGLSTNEEMLKLLDSLGLNPFGTGQGLSTPWKVILRYVCRVSIPLEQGRVFRLSG